MAELGCRLQKAKQETHTDSDWRNYSKLRREADSFARFLHVAPAAMSDAGDAEPYPTGVQTANCREFQAFQRLCQNFAPRRYGATRPCGGMARLGMRPLRT